MKAAFIIIDLQNGLLASKPPPLDASDVIARINYVSDAIRKQGFTVIFMQHDGKAEENVLPFTEGWKLHRDVQVDPGDLVLRKTTCDAFFETRLEAEVRARSVDTLILAGYATEFCVDSTLRNACSKSFQVVAVSDAHTTNDNPVLKARQVVDHHNWAWASTTARPPVLVLKSEDLVRRLAT